MAACLKSLVSARGVNTRSCVAEQTELSGGRGGCAGGSVEAERRDAMNRSKLKGEEGLGMNQDRTEE